MKRRAHRLGRLKKMTKINKLVFVDTETSGTPAPDLWSGKGKPMLHTLRLGWMCMMDAGGEEWNEIRKVEEFYENLEGFIRKDREPCFIFAYNSGFDYQVLGLMKRLNQRPGWKHDSIPFMEKGFVFKTEFQGSTVYWLDAMNYVGGFIPLKDLGEVLNLPKLDVDRKSIDEYSDEVVSEYCRRDVEITRKYVLEWLTFLIRHDCGKMMNTLAGQCLTAFRHRFMDEEIYIHSSDFVSSLERDSYRGGRNEAFYLGEVKEHVYKLDVNSFHPFIMANRNLPKKVLGYGQLLSLEKFEKMKELTENDPEYCYIIDAMIEVTEPCVCKRLLIKPGVERNVFPVGRFRAAITNLDVKLIESGGGRIVTIYRWAAYEATVLFRRYIDEFYGLRLKYKSEGNRPFDQMCKYFMNSLEGKFAQKSTETDEITGFLNGDRPSAIVDDVTGKIYRVSYIGGRAWCKTGGNKEGYNTFVPISSFIRSWTRYYIWLWIKAVTTAGGHVYYTDTDSLIVDKIGYEVLLRLGYIHPTELGKLKLEAEADDLIIRGAKDYHMDGEWYIKGVSKKAETHAPDDAHPKEWYTQTYFARMPGMLRRGIEEGVLIVDDFEKMPTRDYYKGTVTESGWVEPLILMEDKT
jgi:hypothetical protein